MQASVTRTTNIFNPLKHLLVLGAGRSATHLIDYLIDNAAAENWTVTVADMDLAQATQKIAGRAQANAITLDGADTEALEAAVSAHHIVVSLLPPHMHVPVAQLCLTHGRHLVTASYISADMAALHEAAKAQDLIFLNEIGADPGIDHLNIKRGIDKIQSQGGKILELYSYCGSLIAPESNDNPWGYKFTWSPMNVILAGQGAACYIHNGSRSYIPYNRLFTRIDNVEIEGIGKFDAYANRDSYSYKYTYNLPHIQTLLRGTLRMEGYCEGWNALIQLGLTANDYKITDADKLSYRSWVASYVQAKQDEELEHALARFLQTSPDSPLMQRLASTGLLSETPVKRKTASPAELLYDLLIDKWVFQQDDKDMLVMVDKIVYERGGERFLKTASMATVGKDYTHTAISQTVGLPAAIAVKLIAQGKIEQRGVLAPVTPDIYLPILNELALLGINFTEKIEKIA